MADYWDQQPSDQSEPSWSDYGTVLSQGAVGVQADLEAASRYIASLRGDENVAAYRRAKEKVLRRTQGELLDELSPVARDRLEASVTSGEFWRNAFSAGALKATGMAPSVLASVLPAAPLRNMVSSAVAIAGSGGTLSAAQIMSEFDSQPDAMSDVELRENAPVYNGYRELGMDESQAREQYRMDMLGAKPAVGFFISALTNAFGPGAQALRAVRGEGASLIGGAKRGLLGRVGASVAEGGVSEGIDEGAGNLLAQQALIQGGLQNEYDTSKLADNAVEGLLMGGVLSAPAAVPGRVRARKAENRAPEVRDSEQAAVENAGPPPVDGRTGNPPGPAEDVEIGNPQSAPTRDNGNSGKYAKTDKAPKGAAAIEAGRKREAKRAKKTAASETIAPNDAVSPELREAIAGETGAPAPKPEQLAAAAVEQAALIRRNELAVTEQVTPPVTPENASGVPAPLENSTSELPAESGFYRQVITPIPGRRVLESSGTEQSTVPIFNARGERVGEHTYVPEEAKAELAKRQIANEAAALAEPKPELPEETPAKPDKNIKRRNARQEHEAIAQQVVSEYAPKDNESHADTVARAQAIVDKAEPMLAALVEKHGLKRDDELRQARILKALVGKPEKYGTDPGARAAGILREAKDLLRKLNAQRERKSPDRAKITKAIEEFRLREMAMDLGVQIRREEGDAAMKIAEAPDLERMKAPEGGGDAGNERLAESPEELLSRKQEALEEDPDFKRAKDEAIQREAAAAEAEVAARRERARQEGAPRLLEAPKAPAVEKKGERKKLVDLAAVRAKREAARAENTPAPPAKAAEVKPAEVTTKPTSKAERAKTEVPKLLDELRAKGDDNDVVAKLRDYGVSKNDIDTAIADFYLREEAPAQRAGPGRRAPAARTSASEVGDGANGYFITRDGAGFQVEMPHIGAPVTLEKALQFAGSPAVNVPGRYNLLLTQLRDKLVRLAKDVPVYVVPDESLKRNNNGSPYYDPVNHHIVVPEGALAHIEYLQHTLVHEGIHAISSRALEADQKFAKAVRSIMDLVKHHKPDLTAEYGFRNEHEFLAEALSNRGFQKALRDIKLSPALSRTLGVNEFRGRFGTAWDVFVDIIRVMLGLDRNTMSALEAALRLTEEVSAFQQNLPNSYLKRIEAWSKEAPTARLMQRMEESITKQLSDTVKSVIERPEAQKQLGAPALLKLRMFNQLAQAADRFWPGDNNPVRRIDTLLRKSRSYADAKYDEALPLIKRSAELAKKYRGEQWDEFLDLAQTSTNAGVDPTGEPIKGEKLRQVQARAIQGDLRNRWNALPDDLKAHWREQQSYFRKAQDEAALSAIENSVFKALDVRDPALARRILDRTETDADVEFLGADLIKKIRKAGILTKVDGAYFPQIREGSHVVRAKVKVPEAAGAKKLADNQYEFSGPDAQKQAEAYAGKLIREDGLHADVERVYVDKNTGDTHVIDDDGEEVKVSPKDVDAEKRFRVTVQDELMELHDSAKAAQVRAAELAKDYGDKVLGVEELKREPRGENTMTPPQLQSLIKSIEQGKGYKKATEKQRQAIKRGLIELSIQTMGSTRIQSRRLPRRKVKGASKDVTKSLYTYANSMSKHLGRMKYLPEVEAARAEMWKATEGEYAKDSSLGRSSIANEVDRRLDMPMFEETGKHHAWVKRLMTASFLDKLAGPSYSIIGATQTAMLSMPVVSARHGVGRAFGAFSRAYKDIGGLDVLKQGAKNTVTAAKGAEPTKLMDDIVARAKTAGERDMFKKLMEVRTLDPEAGIEVSPTALGAKGVGGKMDIGLHWAESLSRQMPRAIEAINRSATALAAYRLEFGRSGNHQKAIAYANEVVENTHFIYDHANLPPVFRHPAFKLALQFKNYGQGVYHLIGTNIGKAIRNLEPGDRSEAVKTLVNIAAIHVAMAGALGLPTEPIKYLLIGLSAAGVTSFGMDDLEHEARRIGASMFGKTGGEYLMKGLPRALGIDISGRVGLDSITSFGNPKSEKLADIGSWIASNVAGAPAALVTDWAKGSQELTKGEWVKAAELLVPFKTFADSMRAYRMATEGRKSATSGKQTLTPYDTYESAARVLGFTPQREAEDNAARGAIYSKQQDLKAGRQQMISKWVYAAPSDKRDAWTSIQKWNKGRPTPEQIKMSELSASAKRAATAKTKEILSGVATNSRNRHLMQDNPYNIGTR